MTYLLDVSTLLAWLWQDHEHHDRVIAWADEESLAVCPIVELGFLRISTQPVFGASVQEARRMLNAWLKEVKPKSIPCDLKALDGTAPPSGGRTTHHYLADLAAKHGMMWATLDERSGHPAAFVVPSKPAKT